MSPRHWRVKSISLICTFRNDSGLNRATERLQGMPAPVVPIYTKWVRQTQKFNFKYQANPYFHGLPKLLHQHNSRWWPLPLQNSQWWPHPPPKITQTQWYSNLIVGLHTKTRINNLQLQTPHCVIVISCIKTGTGQKYTRPMTTATG